MLATTDELERMPSERCCYCLFITAATSRKFEVFFVPATVFAYGPNIGNLIV